MAQSPNPDILPAHCSTLSSYHEQKLTQSSLAPLLLLFWIAKVLTVQLQPTPRMPPIYPMTSLAASLARPLGPSNGPSFLGTFSHKAF